MKDLIRLNQSGYNNIWYGKRQHQNLTGLKTVVCFCLILHSLYVHCFAPQVFTQKQSDQIPLSGRLSFTLTDMESYEEDKTNIFKTAAWK